MFQQVSRLPGLTSSSHIKIKNAIVYDTKRFSESIIGGDISIGHLEVQLARFISGIIKRIYLCI